MTEIQGVNNSGQNTCPTEGPSDPNYIPSSDDDSSSESNDSIILGIAGDTDSGTNDVFNDMSDESQYYHEKTFNNGAGDVTFWETDGGKLSELYRRMIGFANLRMILSMMMDQSSELKDAIHKTNLDTNLSDVTSKTNLVENTTKQNAKSIKSLSKATSILMKKIDDYNTKQYNEALAKIGGGGGCWGNFWTSDGDKLAALEAREDLQQAYKSVMNSNTRSFNQALGTGYKGATQAIEDVGNKAFSQLRSADDYIQFDENGYIDLPKSKQWMVDLRRSLTAANNLNRFYADSVYQRESMTKTLMKTFSEKSLSLSDRLSGLEGAVQEENSYQAMMFDKLSGEALKVQKLKNDIKETQTEIKKLKESRWCSILANIFQGLAVVIGAVLAVVLAVVTFGTGTVFCALVYGLLIAAVVAGAAAASFTYGAAEIQDANRCDYNPTLKTFNPSLGRRGSGQGKANNILEKSDDLEYEERRLQAEIGLGQIDTMSDGYLAVNGDSVGALQKKLGAIQNAERFMARLIKESASRRKTLMRALTGLDLGKAGGEGITNSVEAIIAQSSTQFGAISSNLSEYKNAQNRIIQQDRALENAKTTFYVSLACAVVCAAIGACIPGVGPLLGFAIGQALGSAIAGLINTYRYDTRNTSYTPRQNANQARTSTGRLTANGVTIGDYDAMVNNVFVSQTGKGRTIGAGDGNIAINTDKVQQMLTRMMRIFTVVSNILSAIESKRNIIKGLTQSFGVVVDEGDTGQNILKAIFDTDMQVFNSNVKMIAEEVEVHNRANAAKKDFDMAWTKFGLTVGLLAVSAAVGGALSSVAIFSVCWSVSQLLISAADFTFASLRARSDYGDLKGQLAAQEAQEKKKVQTGRQESRCAEEQIIDRLEVLEQQAMAAISSSLIQNIGNDHWGVNSGEFDAASSKLEALNRIKEIMTEMKSQMSQLTASVRRVMGQVALTSSSNMDMVNYIKSSISNSMLQNKMQALQQYIGRHNQISEAKKDQLVAGVMLAFDAVKTAIGVASAAVGEKANETTKPATDAAARTNNPETNPTPTPEQAAKKEAAAKFKSEATYINLGLSTLQSTTRMILEYVLRPDSNSNAVHKDNKNATESKNADNCKAQKSQGNKETKSGALAMADAVDSWEADSLNYSMESGASQLDVEFSEILTQRSERLGQTVLNEAKSMMDNFSTMCEQMIKDKKEAIVFKEQKAKISAEESREKLLESVAQVPGVTPKIQVAQDNLQTLLQQDSSPANTTALLEAIDQLSKAMEDHEAPSAEFKKAAEDFKAKTQQMKDTMIQDHPEAKEALEATTPDSSDHDLRTIDESTESRSQTIKEAREQTIKLAREQVMARETMLEAKREEIRSAEKQVDTAQTELQTAKDKETQVKANPKSTKPQIAEATQKRKAAEEKLQQSQEKVRVTKEALQQAAQSTEFAQGVQAAVDEYTQRVTQANTTFTEQVQSSREMALMQQMEELMKIEQAMPAKKQIEENFSEATKGLKLEDVKDPQVLIDYRIKLKQETFIPIQTQLAKLRGEKAPLIQEKTVLLGQRNEINEKMRLLESADRNETPEYKELQSKREELNVKITAKEAQISEITSQESAKRLELKSYNGFIGKINRRYTELTGKDMEKQPDILALYQRKGEAPAKPLLTPGTEPEAAQEAPAVHSGASPDDAVEISPVAREAAAPAENPVVTLAGTIIMGEFISDGDKVSLDGKPIDIDATIDTLQTAAEDPALPESDKATISKAIEKLEQVKAETAQSVSASSPKGEQTVAAASTASTETAKLFDSDALTLLKQLREMAERANSISEACEKAVASAGNKANNLAAMAMQQGVAA